MKSVEIAPSILSANFLKLGDEIKDVYLSGAKYLHFDVMDGHFVPNISFGAPILKWISKNKKMILDVHLMISDPLKYVFSFAEAGADIITFHYECYDDETKILECINKIRENNVKVGMSIKPNTGVEEVIKFLPLLDLVLVMSVEPGFGGQKFIESSLAKIKELKKYREANNLDFMIEVDGGINKETGALSRAAGADVLVAGSFIFNNINRKEAIDSLKEVK